MLFLFAVVAPALSVRADDDISNARTPMA